MVVKVEMVMEVIMVMKVVVGGHGDGGDLGG